MINEQYSQTLELEKIKSMLKKLPREKIIEFYGEVMSELDEEEIKNKLQSNEKQNQKGSQGNAGGSGSVSNILGNSDPGLSD